MSSSVLHPVAESLIRPGPMGQAPPAAVFAVEEGGRRHIATAGIADLDDQSALTPDHAFDLASVSKLLTALVVAQLVASRELHLDQRIEHFFGQGADGHAQVTVDDLLRHRAGLAEWSPLYLHPEGRADPVAAALSVPARYARGVGRHYSDLGYQILGGIVARVAGEQLADAVSRRVLAPLDAAGVTAFRPAPGAPVTAGPDGDSIEREMVRSGIPYPVDLEPAAFTWRTRTLRGEVADGNAFHAFGSAAGHAGWFADAAGALEIARALADPETIGVTRAVSDATAVEVDAGQGAGARYYHLTWRGVRRHFVGHPGFTGTFVAASRAQGTEPEVLVALLTNRLHGRPAPAREHLAPVEDRWSHAMSLADRLLHPSTTGERS